MREAGNPPRTAIGDTGAVLAAAALTFLLLVTLDRAFAMVFILNFSVDGPNATAGLVMLFVTGLLFVMGLQRRWPLSPKTLTVLAVAAGIAALASMIPEPHVAVFAAVIFHGVAAPVLVALLQRLERTFALAAALGVLLHVAGRAVLDSAPYHDAVLGVAAVGLGAAGFVILGRRALASPALDAQAPGGLVDPAPFAAFLFMQYAFLGSVAAVSTWIPRDPVQVAAASLLGILAASLLILRGRTLHGLGIAGAAVLFAAALADLLVFGLVGPTSLMVAQITAILLLEYGLTRGSGTSLRRMGISLAIIQFIAIVLIFLEVSAGNWAFMPAPVGAFTRGNAGLFLLLVGVLLPVVVLVPSRDTSRDREPAPKAGARPAGTGRFVGAVLAAAILAASATLYHDARGVPADHAATVPGALTVMTYNVHQWYSDGQTGLVNLAQVRDVIRESGADIVGLQESEGSRITSAKTDGVRWLAHELGMYAYHGPATSEQVYGVSILSKWPIEAAAWEFLPREESIERVAVTARIVTPLGAVPIIVTHLQTEPFAEDRVRQAERIVALAERTGPTIILGDFNTEPLQEDVAYGVLSRNFTDAWATANPGAAAASGWTSPAGTPEERIDYVWLRGAWDVRSARVVGDARASDHLGVVATVAFG